jgi:hypothetical protein
MFFSMFLVVKGANAGRPPIGPLHWLLGSKLHFLLMGKFGVGCLCFEGKSQESVEIVYLGGRGREMTFLTAEEKELLTRAASLMDELLETLEVIKDHRLVEDLKVALREVEEGKAMPLDELVRELNLEGEV